MIAPVSDSIDGEEAPAIAAVARRLREAGKVAVLTGAGISAESGVPTFRDAQTGLWARYRAEDLATPEAFLRDPGLVWRWYAWRREQVLAVSPNPGHQALVELARQISAMTLVTQNVDGLHQRAGAGNVVELHGSIHRLRRFGDDDGHRHDWPTPTGDMPPQINGIALRPDVVWFGEALPEAALNAATRTARESEVFLSIGTSSLVYPAADLPLLARRHGAFIIEINPQATPLSPRFDLCLRGSAGALLPAIIEAMLR